MHVRSFPPSRKRNAVRRTADGFDDARPDVTITGGGHPYADRSRGRGQPVMGRPARGSFTGRWLLGVRPRAGPDQVTSPETGHARGLGAGDVTGLRALAPRGCASFNQRTPLPAFAVLPMATKVAAHSDQFSRPLGVEADGSDAWGGLIGHGRRTLSLR